MYLRADLDSLLFVFSHFYIKVVLVSLLNPHLYAQNYFPVQNYFGLGFYIL